VGGVSRKKGVFPEIGGEVGSCPSLQKRKREHPKIRRRGKGKEFPKMFGVEHWIRGDRV